MPVDQPETAAADLPEVQQRYFVMDNNATDKPHIHDFFVDKGGDPVPFKFMPGQSLEVPKAVAERCAQINKDHPAGLPKPFTVSLGDGDGEGEQLEIDDPKHMTLSQLVAIVALTQPAVATALHGRLEQAATELVRQGVAEAEEKIMAEVEPKIRHKIREEVRAELFPPGTVSATLDELALDPLVARAKKLPGGHRINKNMGKPAIEEFVATGGDVDPIEGEQAKPKGGLAL